MKRAAEQRALAASIEKFGPRSAVDSRPWNSRNESEAPPFLGLRGTLPDKIKALGVAAGSRAKHGAGWFIYVTA